MTRPVAFTLRLPIPIPLKYTTRVWFSGGGIVAHLKNTAQEKFVANPWALQKKGPDHLDEVWGFITPETGGGSGIRTHDEVAPITVFKTVAFVHSAIPPLRTDAGVEATSPQIYCTYYWAAVKGFESKTLQASIKGR